MERPIGVIDSGVGGLTVALELMRQLPNEQLIYLGDTLRCPYGPRTENEVKQFTFEMVDFLLQKNVKMIVVACNTATAFALKDLKEKLSIPVIGVIQPGARAAIKLTKNNKIGIIGTVGTISSNAYPEALKRINNRLDVSSLACPRFVPMVERGNYSETEAYGVVNESLLPLQHTAIDTLVLGCTHYPLLEEIIQEVIGEKVRIISSSEETARETSTVLDVHDLLNKSESPQKHQFYATGDIDVFKKIAQNIFKELLNNFDDLTIEKIIL